MNSPKHFETPGDKATHFLRLIATPDLPGLGPGARPSALDAHVVESRVADWLRDFAPNHTEPELLRSAALLWHDHLEASHMLSQSIDTSSGSFLHGIMHRREPDYSNAKYWFRRVQGHSAYEKVFGAVQTRLTSLTPFESVPNWMAEGIWDPYGFVDAVESALHAGQKDEIESLQWIQQIEFEYLVRSFF
jgi:hypothetical protein